jgi:hypothetical protein
MTHGGQKDFFARLADLSEEAIQRFASTPGADRIIGGVMGAMNSMREQLDALSARVRGMESLERRVDALEREVATLRGDGPRAPARAETGGSSGAADFPGPVGAGSGSGAESVPPATPASTSVSAEDVSSAPSASTGPSGAGTDDAPDTPSPGSASPPKTSS